jgi:DNA-binding transcriptional regulator PaaX
VVSWLNYNELKLLILRVIMEHGSIDGSSLSEELSSKEFNVEIHAVRMALMRYYKLGLLKRVRAGGAFSYSLSERGIARLDWLKKQTKSKEQ